MRTRENILIDLALEEDAGLGDLTSRSIFAPEHQSSARIIARQQMTLCGLAIAGRVFTRCDPSIRIRLLAEDGQQVDSATAVLEARGSTISLLSAERTALNFLQRLSGIASVSARYAAAATRAGTGVRVVDTRKTIPAWRGLEKYAVRLGGCFNHRSSLGEHVLIKENHILAAGSLAAAVRSCREAAPHGAKIEVETESLQEVEQAIAAGAEIIMLDNMSVGDVKRSVALIDGAAIIEISGGVNLETLNEYALAGVDVISVGALTHSAPAADLSMVLDPRREEKTC